MATRTCKQDAFPETCPGTTSEKHMENFSKFYSIWFLKQECAGRTMEKAEISGLKMMGEPFVNHCD